MIGPLPDRPEAMPLEDRKALLARAFGHGQAITQLATIGESYAALERYVSASNNVSESDIGDGKRLTFTEVVHWDVTLDAEGTILGFSQSGYGKLMAKLGIDMAGEPYLEGDI